MLTGGGSGGHITPILAVAEELKALDSSIRIIFVGQTGDALSDVPKAHAAIDEVHFVRAGKFRRYHGAGISQLADLKTLAKNTRDFFNVITGYYQSRALLKRLKPDVIFMRGGFVGVPVGLAAGRLHIPYITHDSDAIASLANRIISKKASLHAVSAPISNYPYPPANTVEIGVPVSKQYHPLTAAEQGKLREKLHFAADAQIIMLTGGGNGAQLLNEVLAANAAQLLQTYPKLELVHIAGRGKDVPTRQLYEQVLSPQQMEHVRLLDFTDDLASYSGVADIVICRAGATTLAEFALQGKVCVVIPNPHLTGGHQLKNSDYLAKAGAITMLSQQTLEDSPHSLFKAIDTLLGDPPARQRQAELFAAFGRPDVAHKQAELILETARKFRRK